MSSEMHGMFPTAMEFLGYQSKNSLADNATDTDIATANLGSWRGFGAAAEEQRSNSGCWPPSGIAVSGLSSIPSSHNFQSLAAASRKEFHGGRSAENRKLGVSMDMAEIIQQGSDGSNKQQHEQAYLVNTSGSSNNSRYHHQQQHGYSFFDASSSTTAANVLAAAHHSALGLNLPSLEHHHHQQQQQLLPFSIPVSSSTRWQQSNQADLGVVSNLSSVYPQHYSNGMAAVNNWLSSSTTTRGPLDASASAAGGGGGGGSSSQRLALSLSSSSSYSYRPPHPPEVQMISPGGGGGGNLFQMGGESSRSVTASGRNSDGPVFMGLDALTAAVSHQPSRESAAAAAIIRGEGAARSLFSGYGNCLRNSIYFKPAQELLLEFCNVGCCGEAKLDKDTASNKKKATVLDYSAAATASGKTDEEFKSKKGGFTDDTPGLFPGDTYELQKRKAKLLSMLEEVDMRYKNYCSQLQMVVAAMEAVTAPGCAKPYTRLAVKAMSRHFRCLRDAITGQLQATARLLGENQVTLHGNTTRGETPRLGLMERALRQHQHHHNNQNSPRLLDPHPWRPQRGLPERSVSILRSWLFEHFLHPYPTDGDKHILAKQTGLTRSQVSNWFINARVRLWKPMVEEMYMEELKEEKMEKEEVKDDAAGAEAAETDAEKNPATTMNQATATGAADTVSYLQQQRFPSGNGGSSSFKVVAPAPTEMADSETTTSSSRREMATTPTTTQTQTQIQITMDEGPHPYKRLLQQQQQQQLGPATAQTPGLQSACNVQDFVAYPAENLHLRYSSNNSTKKSSGAADNLGSNQNINNGVSLTLGLRHSGLPYHLSEPTAKYSAAAAGSGIYMAPRTTTATAAANSTQHHDAHILEDSTAKNNGSSVGGLIHQDLQQQYRHYTNGPRLLHDFVQG